MSVWKQLSARLASTGRQCVYCGREIPAKAALCAACAQDEQKCYAGAESGGIPHVFRYEGVVRALILKLKYDDRKDLAVFAAARMFRYCTLHGLRADVVTYVPVHKNRLKARGFDQSACIARELARLLGVPCETLLVRVKDTKPQFDLSPGERRENMKEAFRLAGKESGFAGKRVLVVDDIYTTGTTMQACLACLSHAEAVPFVLSKEYENTEND
ncbi:MAG TPA: hypothetical protein DEB31_11440 [Clostridiales bacterium]|nr:hypothetical protein [Clostridiales bacterium]